ncbi:MAG: uridine diphosphate-N-acetylglucosamine-binding protein YvcK [Actinomycetota bacterium]
MTSTADHRDQPDHIGTGTGTDIGTGTGTAGSTGPPDHGAGPAVVALGGGHGLATSLRAARTYAGSVCGIVSVGDDGGSSGRLRHELRVAPPGDVRRCLSALAADDSLLVRSMEHRFVEGSLQGHPIGNLLLTGLAMVSGDLQTAIDEVGRLIGATGRIFPATEVPVTLIADSDGGTLAGQVTIERAAGIRNLRFDPADPPTSAAAVGAVAAADQIVIGPGSLFTSVLATAVVPGIRDALNATSATRVFVANVANDKAEARGFGLAEHIDALTDHHIPVDVVVASSRSIVGRSLPVPVVEAEVAADDGWSHDAKLLGETLAGLAGARF